MLQVHKFSWLLAVSAVLFFRRATCMDWVDGAGVFPLDEYFRKIGEM
jgi:hypothetical protein